MSIHKLTGHQLPGEVNDDLIEALEGLLDRARRGEITCLAWSGHSANDISFNGWEGSGGTSFHLMAGIALLHARFAARMLEDDE